MSASGSQMMQLHGLAKRHDACTFCVADPKSVMLSPSVYLFLRMHTTCCRACADSACPELMLPVVEPQTTAHTNIDSEEANMPWHHQLMAIGETSFTMLHHPSPSFTMHHHPSPSVTILHHPSLSVHSSWHHQLIATDEIDFITLHHSSPPLNILHHPSPTISAA